MLQLVPAFCTRLAGDAAATKPMTADMQPSVYMDLLAHRMVCSILYPMLHRPYTLKWLPVLCYCMNGRDSTGPLLEGMLIARLYPVPYILRHC